MKTLFACFVLLSLGLQAQETPKPQDSYPKITAERAVTAPATPLAAAPAPVRSVPMSEAQYRTLQYLNERFARLLQEERSVASEKKDVEADFSTHFQRWCKDLGGESCQPSTSDPDPTKWTIVVLKPLATSPPEKK